MDVNVRVIIGKILEMDMKSAGISVLRELDHITEQLYLDLCEGDKLSRNIILGKAMIDNKIDDIEISKIVDTEVKKYVNMFIQENKLKPENILEIAKDAVFVYKVTPKKLTFGDYIRFRCKERYFGMIEFPISKTNSNKIKLYKRFTGITIRGAKIDIDHVAYYTLQSMMNAIVDKESKRYYKLLKTFIKDVKSSDNNLINSVDNEYLINVFKSITI